MERTKNQVYMKVWTDEQCDKVWNAVTETLETIGCVVKSEKAREYFRKAGCTIEGDRVKIPASVVNDAVAKAPKASLLAGAWMKKVSTKTELIIADVMMLFGIAAPMGKNLVWVTVCSFIMAFGAGFANTAGMAIISEVFLDEKKRASQMGYYNAAMAVLGIASTSLAGMFAVNGWALAFRVNWFAVPMLIATILFLPEIKPADRPREPEMENNLGDTAFTGICSSLTTVGSLAAALLFGVMYTKLHRKYSLLTILLPIFCYLWLWAAPSAIGVVASAFIYGFCNGGLLTMIYVFAAEIVSAEQSGMAMGLMTFNYSIGITAGVYLFTVLNNMKGSITAVYPYAAAILAIAFVIELIGCVADAKKSES